VSAFSVEARGLTKRYRVGARGEEEFWALRDVSFSVRPGELLGVIGGNGAGKSTLLKILSRVTRPTSGEADLHGRSASLLEVGTGFHPELTGRENIYLNAAIHGRRIREIDRELDAIVAFAGVERFLDTPLKRYSSGMYVRLAFAVAAHLDPDLLLVDEVLAVGDAAFQRKCLGRVAALGQAGGSAIFVSHNMAAVERLCGSVLLLEGGRVAAWGEPRAIIDRYLSAGEHPRFACGVRTGRPQIVSADLRDAQGRPKGRLAASEPFRIRVGYVLPEREQSVHVGIGVLSAAGSPLFASEPRDAGLTLPGEAGEYVAEATLPGGVLLPGEFLVSASLWNEGALLDRQEPALAFCVDAGSSPLAPDPLRRRAPLHVACGWSLLS